MSNFNKINNIKSDFQNNLETSTMFKTTKGLLSSFGEFINNHKSMLYGLIGASVLNVALGSIQNANATPTSSEITRDYTSDYTQLNIAKQIVEFNKNIEMGNNVHQLKAIKTQGVDLNEETLRQITQLEFGTSIEVKNPFWENTVLNVINNTGSVFGFKSDVKGNFLNPLERGVEFQVTHENAHLLVDSSTNAISVDFEELNMFLDNFANVKGQSRDDLIRFMIYHEAAHASARQSYQINPEQARGIDISGSEMHSDIAALTLIGVETKSMDRFNAAIDMIIKTRVFTSISDSDHNTVYPLIELKKAINENPELLNMKKSDISEFSYFVTKKMLDKSFENNTEIIALRGSLSKNMDQILSDMKNGNNSEAINYYAGKVLNKGVEGFNIQEFKEKQPERRWETLAYRISDNLHKHADYIDLASVTYKNSNEFSKTNTTEQFLKVFEKTINKLNDHANKEPVLDANAISVVKNKIKMDELNYDYTKVMEMTKNLKDKDNKIEVTQKTNLKSNKFDS